MSWAGNKGRKGLSQHNKLHGVYDTQVRAHSYMNALRERERRGRGRQKPYHLLKSVRITIVAQHVQDLVYNSNILMLADCFELLSL